MRPVLHLILILAFLLAPLTPTAQAQSGVAASLLARMTAEEKVGQLFLVTFYGPTAEAGSDIERLITEHHIGGVMLLPENNNITDTVNAPTQVLSLTNQLQAIASAVSQIPRDNPADAAEQGLPPFIPLLIGVEPADFSYNLPGLTTLPTPMALGATWDPTQAEAIGQLTGQELSALGINLFLGPSLEVLDTPRPQGPGDLGATVLGGYPFWVGQMGQAFIRGVHQGAANKIAVIATHFPGIGGTDRDPDAEVPTVSKSLEQLKLIELAPFFSVTGQAPNAASTADGVLSAHIRFRGFQGNLLQSTNPVSLDPQALGQLLALSEIKTWRDNGGLTISGALGVPAIKQYYVPFNHKRLAREAFNAGNDMLFLSEFAGKPSGLADNPLAEQTDTIIDTINSFVQQYQTQADFAAKVDAAVMRILALKLRLYGGAFTPARATQDPAGLSTVGQDATAVSAVAQSAATLIFPSRRELNSLPQAPALAERLIFFTDTRPTERLCTTCPAPPRLDKRELELAILARYGPDVQALVRPGNLSSFTLEELGQYFTALDTPPAGEGTPTPEPLPLAATLAQANWVIFNLIDLAPGTQAAQVFTALLSQRLDLVRGKKIIVFDYGAPYYLDATDLTKLTAVYALYSDAPPFVDTAAQLLFRELSPSGDPPVSVPGINYNLIDIIAPDPNQSLQLFSDKEQTKAGDTLQLATDEIVDHNGRPVPDGTRVRFLVKYQDDELPVSKETLTVNGVATTTITLNPNRTGLVEISADSEPAFQSARLIINVQQIDSIITVIAPPTVTPSITPTPTNTPQPTATFTSEPSLTPTPTPTPEPPNRVHDSDFFLLCVGLAAVAMVGYQLGGVGEGGTATRRVRLALAGAIGALLGYNYFALGGPGADWTQMAGVWDATLWVILGGGVGLVAGGWWLYRSAHNGKHARQNK